MVKLKSDRYEEKNKSCTRVIRTIKTERQTETTRIYTSSITTGGFRGFIRVWIVCRPTGYLGM